MSDQYSVRLENRHGKLVEEAEETGIADNQTEAFKTLLEGGALYYGLNGSAGRTRLRRLVARAADAFAFGGVVFLGLTFLLPLEVRLVALSATWGVAVLLFGLDRVLAHYEPRVSARLWGGKA